MTYLHRYIINIGSLGQILANLGQILANLGQISSCIRQKLGNIVYISQQRSDMLFTISDIPMMMPDIPLVRPDTHSRSPYNSPMRHDELYIYEVFICPE